MIAAAAARRAGLLLAVLGLQWLAGCATQQLVVVPAAERDARLMALETWQARGRIAVKAEDGGGQGSLEWRQEGEVSRIRVSGPFGAGAYEIVWSPAAIVVNSRDGEYSREWSGAAAAEQFLAEQLGWTFPAASTRYWLLGLADPGHGAERRYAADGSLAGLVQNGWSVLFERFTDHGGLPMPARMTLQGDRARVRLVIDRWAF